MDPQWINPLYNRQSEPKGTHMQTEGTRITQQPELYLAADVEPYQKGGWKTVVKASIRVFDGDATAMYIQLESMLQSGLAIAQTAISNHEHAMKEITNGPE